MSTGVQKPLQDLECNLHYEINKIQSTVKIQSSLKLQDVSLFSIWRPFNHQSPQNKPGTRGPKLSTGLGGVCAQWTNCPRICGGREGPPVDARFDCKLRTRKKDRHLDKQLFAQQFNLSKENVNWCPHRSRC